MAKKKILVISERGVDVAFRSLADEQHEVVLGKPDEVLVLLATESPDIILFYSEYAERLSEKWRRVATAFEDVKRSIPASVKLVRLGFQPEQAGRNEFYVELPMSEEDFRKIITS
jgi:hypothetical protein